MTGEKLSNPCDIAVVTDAYVNKMSSLIPVGVEPISGNKAQKRILTK